MLPDKLIEYKRRRIEDILADMINRPLGIIAAPSGYGKTTVVRTFFANHPTYLYLWLSLGHEEVDEVWVWNRLCDVCREVSEALSEQMRELGLPWSAQEMDYFTRLLRKYLKGPLFFVLDDYQECCRSETLNRLIMYLIYQNIPHFHLMLIGRLYPDIPYEELYLKQACVLIDQRELELTKEETKEIFCLNGVELSAEELEKMEEYTDGWIAAVYLLLIDYKKQGRFTKFTNVTHLLKTSIFDKFPKTMQEICVKMCLFDSFFPEEAVYVSECDVNPLALMHLSEEYGFIQYDVQSGKLEMHTLLRTFASGELEKRGYDRMALYQRCAEWNASEENYVTAIVNYKKAGNYDHIFRLLSGESRYKILDQAPAIISDVFEQSPEEIKVKYPIAYLTFLSDYMLKNKEQQGRELLERAKKEFARADEWKESYEKLQGELLIVESVAQFNDIDRMTACMREAKKLLDNNPSYIFREPLLTYGAPQMTLLYYKKPGNLKRTVELEKEYAGYYMHLVGGAEDGWDELFDAEYAFLTGDFDKAYRLTLMVKEKAKFRKQTCIIVSSYYLELWCLIYQGNPDLFERKMNEFYKEMKGTTRPVLRMDYELTYSGIYALLGRIDQMADWIRNFDLEECGHAIRSVRSGCIIYATILCMTGQFTLLDAIAGQLLVPYETSRHVYVELCGNLYKAVAVYHLEGVEKAAPYLKKAVKMARPDGLKGPFIERGKELTPIFEECLKTDSFYLSLKPYFRQYEHSVKQFEKGNNKITLTNRERELMMLVKAGCRNSEISEKMNIALVTVEKNLTRIYRKLKVSNRAAAIARTEEWNIY